MQGSYIKKFKYHFLTVFTLLLIATLFSVFIPGRVSEKKVTVPATLPQTEVPSISIKPLKFSQATTEYPRFSLSAEKADFYQDKNNGVLNNFKIVYTYEKGKKITISGLKARINAKINDDMTMGLGNSDIYCDAPITAVSTSGLNFTTENLKWSGGEGIVTTDGRVSLYGENFRIDGKGMKAVLKDEKIELLSDVELTVSPSAVKKFSKNGLI
ncbi:MAG: LPS export ABC transporter periplasmic protein LptC [Candidatus Schekmanbacteria bacterium]|nr:LPS export ABC transporter periplasmic protein LptC [Candidatus Schekmanbacteria bacterium]